MTASRAEQNFGRCELGDSRLNRRALKIGTALGENFGQGLSTTFETARELKRAYSF
ncbi:MAG: transposase DNA-binding-containing protein [Microcoleaceae cyanobacterium]